MATLKRVAMAAALAMAPLGAHAQTGLTPQAGQTPTAAAPLPSAGEQAPAVAAKPADIQHLAPTPGIGQPSDEISLQPQMTAIGVEAANFHNHILMPLIEIITVFVLLLLIWVIVRYNRAVHQTPTRTAHHTAIEIVWTLAPALILAGIAIPSIKLLAHQYDTPKPDITIKVIGNQWYWTYQYPDNGNLEIVSNMLKEPNEVTGKERARTDADGPRLLAVDERMVVPAGKVVKIITTSNDVIHSFAVPAFWTKMDAIPGRLNETWFKVDRPGVYFGECSELCGARHPFMPIAVEVVPPATFARWVLAKGGTMPAPGHVGPATATSPVTAPAAGQPSGAPIVTPTTPTQPGVGRSVTTPQGATANRAGTI